MVWCINFGIKQFGTREMSRNEFIADGKQVKVSFFGILDLV